MKYDVILADPPWNFETWGEGDRNVSNKYSLMDTDAICKLPINELTSENCVLFIWATYPKLFDAKIVMEAWGFTYRTLGFEWIKLNTNHSGWHIGMGYYARANPEPCLLAVRGTMPVAVHGERNLLFEYDEEILGLPMVERV